MLQPERRGVEIFTGPNNTIAEVRINPKKLTREELRHILVGQIYYQEPREILIKDNDPDFPSALHVLPEQLKRIRVAPQKRRRRFINLTTRLMQRSSEIVIRDPMSS